MANLKKFLKDNNAICFHAQTFDFGDYTITGNTSSGDNNPIDITRMDHPNFKIF